ncbi:ATP-binding cassette domain-containing protein [Lachnospiraceae bacterium ZAX-1]
MELVDYSLKVGGKLLLKDVNAVFEKNSINHILGTNGVGKSSFAKSCVGMVKSFGEIIDNEEIILIGSSSNVPNEFSLNELSKLLYNKFDEKKVKKIYELLKLNMISDDLKIKNMSDGQKQKMKLLSFLAVSPKAIILDEFTNALDKISSLDLYEFFNEYVKKNDTTIINITHNLSDLEYMKGHYYYFSKLNILKVESKDEIIEKYVRGD